MSDAASRKNAHCSIPDDPEQSTSRFIVAVPNEPGSFRAAATPFCRLRPGNQRSWQWKKSAAVW